MAEPIRAALDAPLTHEFAQAKELASNGGAASRHGEQTRNDKGAFR